MKDVFISYSSTERGSAKLLRGAIEGEGFQCWFDTDEIRTGDFYRENLRNALNECKVCVFYVTEKSVKRPWCLAETAAFWGAGKPVLPFLTSTTFDREKIPPHLKGMAFTSDSQELIESLRQHLDGSGIEHGARTFAESIQGNWWQFSLSKGGGSIAFLEFTVDSYGLPKMTGRSFNPDGSLRGRFESKAVNADGARDVLFYYWEGVYTTSEEGFRSEGIGHIEFKRENNVPVSGAGEYSTFRVQGTEKRRQSPLEYVRATVAEIADMEREKMRPFSETSLLKLDSWG